MVVYIHVIGQLANPREMQGQSNDGPGRTNHVVCTVQNDTIQNTPPLEKEQAQPLQTDNVHFATQAGSTTASILPQAVTADFSCCGAEW
jgi:hypothetical protein